MAELQGVPERAPYTEFEEGGWDATRLEMYHWHGAYNEDIEPEVARGFDTARADLAFNMYGLGLYFGVGPRGRQTTHARCRRGLR